MQNAVQKTLEVLHQDQRERFIAIRDNRIDVGLWFILELYCRVNGMATDIDEVELPEVTYPYDQAIDAWDTDDLNEINRLVLLLCDIRVSSVEGYETFQLITTQLFPYEILAWLALRKKAGLENPREFTHPLMNTPLAKMFLELQTSLPEPEELPYADELIAKLIENCPKMAAEAELVNETPKPSAKPITASKTGKYRAALPESHPQAEALKTDPTAYRTYKEGERFSNAGLEAYEADKIEWELIE